VSWSSLSVPTTYGQAWDESRAAVSPITQAEKASVQPVPGGSRSKFGAGLHVQLREHVQQVGLHVCVAGQRPPPEGVELEVIGGYYVLDCQDTDETLRWVAILPSARYGAIEVRPLMVMPGHD
jgi:hypothetical protein